MLFRDISRIKIINRRAQWAFTLLELLIAMAIAAALAAIAVPAYQKYMERLKVNQAVAEISSLSLDLEHYYGGQFTYPATLSGLGKTIPLDPWGHAYKYVPIDVTPRPSVGKILKDKSLHPVNSDFDLYSLGPDGRSSTQLSAGVSQDNIIRAGNGSYIGQASGY